jgi:hypothetical protein
MALDDALVIDSLGHIPCLLDVKRMARHGRWMLPAMLCTPDLLYYLYVLLVCTTCMYYLYVLLVCTTCMYYLYVLVWPVPSKNTWSMLGGPNDGGHGKPCRTEHQPFATETRRGLLSVAVSGLKTSFLIGLTSIGSIMRSPSNTQYLVTGLVSTDSRLRLFLRLNLTPNLLLSTRLGGFMHPACLR